MILDFTRPSYLTPSIEKYTSKGLNTRGVFFALIGAIGQGMGVVFAKKGIFLESGMMINPLSAALILLALLTQSEGQHLILIIYLRRPSISLWKTSGISWTP